MRLYYLCCKPFAGGSKLPLNLSRGAVKYGWRTRHDVEIADIDLGDKGALLNAVDDGLRRYEPLLKSSIDMATSRDRRGHSCCKTTWGSSTTNYNGTTTDHLTLESAKESLAPTKVVDESGLVAGVEKFVTLSNVPGSTLWHYVKQRPKSPNYGTVLRRWELFSDDWRRRIDTSRLYAPIKLEKELAFEGKDLVRLLNLLDEVSDGAGVAIHLYGLGSMDLSRYDVEVLENFPLVAAKVRRLSQEFNVKFPSDVDGNLLAQMKRLLTDEWPH